MPIPADLDAHLTGEFKTGMIGSLCADPATCCFAYCCMPCALYSQRKELLDLTGEPYVMCAGTWPCCGFEKPCPDNLLCVEACCLAGGAMSGNRFMVHSRLNIKNTSIENLLQVFNLCVTCQFFLLRLCLPCTKEQEDLVKSSCCGCPCMHCQNSVEIDAFRRAGKPYGGPPDALMAALPKHFATIGRTPAAAPTQMKPM